MGDGVPRSMRRDRNGQHGRASKTTDKRERARQKSTRGRRRDAGKSSTREPAVEHINKTHNKKRKYQAPVMTVPPERLLLPRGLACGDAAADRDMTPAETRDDDSISQTSTHYHLTTTGGNCGIDFGRVSPERDRMSKWYEKRMPILSHSYSDGQGDQTLGTDTNNTMLSSDDGDAIGGGGGGGILGAAAATDIFQKEDGDYLKTKQSVAWLSISVTVVQLLVLMLQLAMCGIAALDVNPMFGPFPDAFSEWGGKNAYLMKEGNEWWRLVTPSFLHVGFLHLLANAFCQLEAIALFEREWGSKRWLLIYLISSVGCNAFSSFFDPDSIAVGSSGALMGLYAAKLSQVASNVFFEVTKTHYDDGIRLDQLSSVLCGLTIVSLLSSFTYIDWSGHMGGLLTGLLSGMVLFSYTIRRCCSWFLWSSLGFLGLVASLTAVLYYFVEQTEPDEEMGDACEYFRNLFPEGYECGCMWT